MHYSEEIIEDVRRSNDIVEIISEYVNLKAKGNYYFGLCPFHNEKTPSFSVTKEKQMYHCFGCGASGNVITFVMKLENYTFIEAIQYLAKKSNIQLPEPEMSEQQRKQLSEKEQLYKIHIESAKYFYHNLISKQGEVALQYISNRKLTEKTRKAFGLGYSNPFRNDLFNYLIKKGFASNLIEKTGLIIPEKNKQGYFDRFWNRVMFPIFDVHSRIIGFGGRNLDNGEPKYLNSPETILFNKREQLYGFNIAKNTKKDEVLLVEGYMDVISLHQAGFTNAVASLGTAFTSGQASLIKKYKSKVIIVYDSDDAGTNAIIRAIPILLDTGIDVKIMQTPNAKDPDEFIQKYGVEAFGSLMSNAMTHIDFKVKLLKSKYDINNTDQKIRFAKEVVKILQEIHNSIEKEEYIKKISKDIEISEETIKREVEQKPETINYNYQNRVNNNHKEKNNNVKQENYDLTLVQAQRNLLTLIIKNRKVYEGIKDYLKEDEITYPLYKQIYLIVNKVYENTLKSGKSFFLADMINYFESVEDQQEVAKILEDEWNYASEKEIEKAMNEQLKLVKQKHIDQKILEKSEVIKIASGKQKIDIENEMLQLAKERTKIKKLYIFLNN